MGFDFKKWKERLKKNRLTRAAQFANYLAMVDKYKKKGINLRNNMVSLGNPDARAGTGRLPTTTKLSTILNRYHNTALRIAQAKYYQKHTG